MLPWVEVICYAGYTFPERPLAFRLGGELVPVEEVLASWKEPAGPAFRVRTARGTFLLAYDWRGDRWYLKHLAEP